MQCTKMEDHMLNYLDLNMFHKKRKGTWAIV